MPATQAPGDPFDLQRFVRAQAGAMQAVRTELAAGLKRTHWMWFVFPQLRVLGRSQMARHFGIGSLDEARAYWAHPVLGPRLRECFDLLLSLPASADAVGVMGEVDALKLCSCLTLFEAVAADDSRIDTLLARWYAGERDGLTIEALAAGDG
jgi:uncharacterized protein (DUF1810 family)